MMVCLDAIRAILRCGKAQKKAGIGHINIYQSAFYECDGLDKIEELQYHQDDGVYKKASKILDRYWIKEEEEDTDSEMETEMETTTATAATTVANPDADVDIDTQLNFRRLSLT